MSDVMTFDISPVHVDIVIDSEDYVLKEASSLAVTKFQNAAMKSFKMEMDEDGKTKTLIDGSGSLADQAPLLLSMCLYKKGVKDDKTTLSAVSMTAINSWPNRVVKSLFEKAKEISDFGEDETVETLEKEVEKTQSRIEKLKEKEEKRKNS